MQKNILLFTILVTMAHAALADGVLTERCNTLSSKNIPLVSTQVLLVEPLDKIHVAITACQRKNATWIALNKVPFKGVMGKEGAVPAIEKKEGDLKTPRGMYLIGDIFGSTPLALRMNYKYITREDKFVDDVTSNEYNTWVQGETKAKHFENMMIPVYEMGAVINYNMHPVVKGAGSAIFLHIWRSEHEPTAGCIALDKSNLLTILYWFDKAKYPYLFIP